METSVAARPRLAADLVRTLCQNSQAPEDVNENAPSEILHDFLFLGDADNASSLHQLQHFRINRMLSVTTARELGEHDGIERQFLYIRDVESENIAMLFDPACDFINTAKSSGSRVMVHCMAGRSRSAALVIVYLMRSLHMTLNDAFSSVKKKRPIVFPNCGFWQQLMEEEFKLFGSNSPVPKAYEKALAVFEGGAKLSPSKLFKQYMVAAVIDDIALAKEGKRRTLEEWLSIWPATQSIEDVFMCSIEQVQTEARALAVEFIGELYLSQHFTLAEVCEGFSLLQALDLEDLRIDVPKVDEYIAEMIAEAEKHGLL